MNNFNYEIRNDSVHIEGYVNAVERDSNVINTREGRCVESVSAGAFGDALSRAENVDILLNHKVERKLGSTTEGNLQLYEDSIGLRAVTDITDADVIEKARKGELRGWSFGFIADKTRLEKRSEGVPRRHIDKMSVYEVSLIDNTMNPCYNGCNVEVRAEGEIEYRGADVMENINRNEQEQMKLELEMRYNPYHDPSNGRFTSGGGSGGGYVFMVPKGRAGRGVLMHDVGIGDNKIASAYYHAVYNNSNINNGKHNLVNGANANTTSTASGTGNKFGVTGGAGTAYTIVTTSEGNKAIRNDFILTDSNGTVYISNRSTATPKPTAISPDYTKSAHSMSPDSIGGVKQGKAMTFEQADNGNANPNYRPNSGYSKNCQSCVVTHEARIRGYDIETKAKSGVVMLDLSHDTTLAWIDPKTGKKPQLNALTGNKGVELDRIVKPGERYSLEYMHDKRSGHIITAARDENNKIRLYDPQTNKKITGTNDINDYLKGKSQVRYLRVDNLEFNEDIVNAISKKHK